MYPGLCLERGGSLNEGQAGKSLCSETDKVKVTLPGYYAQNNCKVKWQSGNLVLKISSGIGSVRNIRNYVKGGDVLVVAGP